MGVKLTRGIMLLLLVPLLSLLLACDQQEQEQPAAAFNGTIFFAGSSTLAVVIAQIGEQFTRTYATWDQVDATLPAEKIRINVITGGSGAGARAVLDGTADFGMVGREVRDSERTAMSNYQSLTVGIDALLLATHQDNPLAGRRHDLTAAEVRRIFSGEISHWQEFNPELPAEEIVLLVRDVGGGAHSVFQNSVMGQTEVSNRAVQAPTMTALVPRLAGNRRAIGYASYSVAEAYGKQLAVFSLDGVEPSVENIINGDYPVSRPLILLWNHELSVAERALLDYIRSDAGIWIIRELGYLPAI
ncbi:phosphate ABC transporter substrate-binding protein [Desulfurivibrio alkaliphilus]|uniref:Putative phosphate ABC transporter substrate-binding protein n=1 Tax=Desulfurivibrio alkaliphilus (strain DSM 19089 / UNIQEM U267 / AHT2) TaxID=589865 RepID=D6Z1H7_DESAT|nr:phosphate ABC transporter substrate-binding protein [Desulfurivibrio alkaliphilus]ADH87311.1 putative phosphate ABC transporter substrate-binding protein [Desulfurivibrio alkaliphilus AHT 2]